MAHHKLNALEERYGLGSDTAELWMEKECKGKQRCREKQCLDILIIIFLNQQCWCFYLFAPSLRRRGQQH